MSLNLKQELALAATRVSLGLLLFWWGLNRILNPGKMVGMQKKFYFDLFPNEMLQYTWGYVQVVIGLLVIFGLFRIIAVPAQLAICGFSAMTIWSALLDPFHLYLPVAKLKAPQHLFYPSVIILCSSVFLFTMRKHDRFCFDRLFKRGENTAALNPAE